MQLAAGVRKHHGSDTTVRAPRLGDNDADRALMKDIGRKVYAIMADAQQQASKDRRGYILHCLEQMDANSVDAAQ
ncbi:MAG: hypothetical protein ACI8W7_003198 [Gammaproteobacteria bacterium]|jgi:hypothetical protein